MLLLRKLYKVSLRHSSLPFYCLSFFFSIIYSSVHFFSMHVYKADFASSCTAKHILEENQQCCTSLSDRIRKYCCYFGVYFLVKLFLQIISRWCRSEWGEQLDQHLVFLFLNILMTSVDDSMTLFAPDQRIKLEQIQLQHITLMHRYLKSTCRKKANSKLADTLMMLQYAKELNRLHSLRLPF